MFIPIHSLTREVLTPKSQFESVLRGHAHTINDAKPLEEKSVSFKIDRAVKTLNRNAHSKSQKRCAYYVRIALAGGGFQIQETSAAKNYGASLEKAGFKPHHARLEACELTLDQYEEDYTPQKGDVAIFQPPADQPDGNGHMQMFNGTIWVSDFRQNDFCPYSSPSFRAFTIYRHPDYQ